MELKEKVALITGAASGIGLETSKLFIKAGAIVAVIAINLKGIYNVTQAVVPYRSGFGN